MHQVGRWCAYVMHVQGMAKHIWVKVCKTHNQWSEHDKQVQSWKSPKFGTHWSPKQYQNAIWAFYQHLVCTYKINMWAMHEHVWILPKYMIKCHNWPTQSQTNQMRQSPIEKLKEFSQNLKFPTLFQKYPNSSKT